MRASTNLMHLLHALMCVVANASVLLADNFPEIYNSEPDKTATPMAAAEAASTMKVPEGFRVNIWAAEPDVQNPIASTWDAKGRLWVAENYTYAERSQRFDLGLRDRVIILEDTNSDELADKRTVFTDQVQMLTSVEVGHGGVWLMCPPVLMFYPDADQDDKPDGEGEVVLDGFEVASENYHNFANGLRFGPDGWLYGRCGGSCPGLVGQPGTAESLRVPLEGGIWRYHPMTKRFEVLTHGTTNPWGHDWNAEGQGFFINTVNGHLWHLIPGAHFVRPFTLDPNTKTFELIDMHADHWHFDTGKKWQDSRDGAANDYGGGHAHCGTMIYLGDNWPQDYRNQLFTLNLHGRRINQELLLQDGSGYVAKHGEDMCLSQDSFFRGMDLSYGPDGAVYILDWSDTGECHEHTGVHRNSGRIFRVSYGETAKSNAVDIASANAEELIQLHQVDNEWYIRQARIKLIELYKVGKLASKSTDLLKEWARSDDQRLACRAILTLDAFDLDGDVYAQFLKHSNEHVRVLAIRAVTDHWQIDDVYSQRTVPDEILGVYQSGPTSPTSENVSVGSLDYRHAVSKYLPILVELANSDKSGLVRLTLASTLQRLPVDQRVELAKAIASHTAYADDHNLPLLVWYGLIPVAESNPESLAAIVGEIQWPKLQQLIIRRLAERMLEAPTAIDAVLLATQSSKASVHRGVLEGMQAGFKGWQSAPKPPRWESYVESLSNEERQEFAASIQWLSSLFGEGLSFDEAKKLILDNDQEIGLRQSALEALVRTKSEEMRSVCEAVLGDARLNVVAAQGLAQFDDAGVAEKLLSRYRNFRAPQRPSIISLLCSRVTFAKVLMRYLADGKIAASEISAYDARQLVSLNDASITDTLAKHWGELRDTPDQKLSRIASLKAGLKAADLSKVDKSAGRALFAKNCGKCHRLFGEGEKIGPELTGADRKNLDYLIDNIVDPSAVVSKDYRMSILQLKDDRILNGLITSQNEQTITLQTQIELLTIAKSEVEEIKQTSLSPMPDGLLELLSADEIQELFAYLMHPVQVPMPQGK